MGFLNIILSSTTPADDTPVFLIAGQSNAVGWDTGAPADQYLNDAITGCQIYTGSAWQTLEFGVNNEGNGAGNHGIELNLGYLATQYYNNTSRIIKLGDGATYLAQKAGDDWNMGSVGELYDDLITKVTNGVAGIGTYRYKGLIWIQGESDGLNATDANAYETNLTAFINALRTDLDYQIPVVLIKVNSGLVEYYPYIATVRTAMDNVATTLQKVFTVDTQDAAYTGTVHYTSAYFNTMADTCFNLIKTL